MSVDVRNIFVVAILIVINSGGVLLAQTNCVKIDFNRTTFPEFETCLGKNLPNFMIKSYATQNELTPFRPTTNYYLSNNFFDSYSCAESSLPSTIKVNPTTIIEVAVNLKSKASSFLEIILYDADRNERIDSVRTDGTNGYQIIHKQIQKTIANARVCSMFVLACLNFVAVCVRKFNRSVFLCRSKFMHS